MQAGPGERVQAYLEMRLMCDIGLVGAPNAGKSSLLRALTASAPKVSHLMLRLTPQSNLWPGLKFSQPAPSLSLLQAASWQAAYRQCVVC